MKGTCVGRAGLPGCAEHGDQKPKVVLLLLLHSSWKSKQLVPTFDMCMYTLSWECHQHAKVPAVHSCCARNSMGAYPNKKPPRAARDTTRPNMLHGGFTVLPELSHACGCGGAFCAVPACVVPTSEHKKAANLNESEHHIENKDLDDEQGIKNWRSKVQGTRVQRNNAGTQQRRLRIALTAAFNLPLWYRRFY
jgi:hypothetical protein